MGFEGVHSLGLCCARLGYIVQAFPAVTEDVCGFSVLVQGPRQQSRWDRSLNRALLMNDL